MNKMIWMAVLLVGMAAEAWAGTPFEKVATDINNEYRNARKEQTLTLEEIEARRVTLRQKLAASEEALAAASGTLEADRERLRTLSQERDEITKEVSRRLADNKELSVLFISHARNFLALAERSPYSAEKPDRLCQLRSFVDPKRVFRLADLKALLVFSFEDMAASREKVMYQGDDGGP